MATTICTQDHEYTWMDLQFTQWNESAAAFNKNLMSRTDMMYLEITSFSNMHFH